MDVGFQNMKFEQLSLLFIGGSEGVRIYNYESAAEPGCATPQERVAHIIVGGLGKRHCLECL